LRPVTKHTRNIFTFASNRGVGGGRGDWYDGSGMIQKKKNDLIDANELIKNKKVHCGSEWIKQNAN
jgi:hypothetical protein